jgi:hypothetical protein
MDAGDVTEACKNASTHSERGEAESLLAGEEVTEAEEAVSAELMDQSPRGNQDICCAFGGRHG